MRVRSTRSRETRWPGRSTRVSWGTWAGARVRWNRAWTEATRMRAWVSAADQSASVATRDALSSRTSSERSQARAVRGSRVMTAAGSPSQAASSSAARSAISASRAIQSSRCPVAWTSAAARYVLAPWGTPAYATWRRAEPTTPWLVSRAASSPSAPVPARMPVRCARSGMRCRALPPSGSTPDRPPVPAPVRAATSASIRRSRPRRPRNEVRGSVTGGPLRPWSAACASLCVSG